MVSKTRLFAILWIAGMAGVLSFLFIDLSALLRALPGAAETRLPFPPLVVKLLGMIQPTVLLTVAVYIGVSLAPRVGLFSPAAEAAARGGSFLAAVKPQILSGVLGGIGGAATVILSWVLWTPFLPPEFVVRAEELNKLLPLPTRLLYGGITEELLLRWGLLTFLVWAAWRFIQKGRSKPRDSYFVCAIVISSIIFGLGHLPVASALASTVTITIICFVTITNSIFGLIAGYLYWKKGLEAAIIAHMLAHVVIVTAIYFKM